MKSVSRCQQMWFVVLLAVMIAASGPVSAASHGIMYQGTLAGPTGAAVPDGTYPMTFSLWSGLAGGTKLWEETGHSVTVVKGAFSVELGLAVSFGTVFDGGASRWLDVRVNLGSGMQIFGPRVPLSSVPYAHWAQDADKVDGLHASGFWQTLGNAGTTSGTHFLGTKDNVALDFRVNNRRALRIAPGTTSDSIIGGHSSNSITSGVFAAAIGGGGNSTYPNTVTDNYGAVGGGTRNQAGNASGTVSDRQFATVGGGYGNTASGAYSVVAGGDSNIAGGTSSTVGGGNENTASGNMATVGGGQLNKAIGERATVPGGENNQASGSYSFAAGYGARTSHNGCFAWVDSTGEAANSTGLNQFRVRSTGGVWFYSATGTTGVGLASGGGSWTSLSDRAAKENFAPVDAGEVLDKVAALPLSTWNYKSQDPSIRHMGPVAQDMRAAFGLGESDTGIDTVDADGVALAAIQGLNQRLMREVSGLRAEIEELKSLVSAMAAK